MKRWYGACMGELGGRRVSRAGTIFAAAEHLKHQLYEFVQKFSLEILIIENAATIKVAANGIIATGGYHQQSGLTQVDGALLLSPNDMVFDGGTLAATGTPSNKTISSGV